MKQFLWKRFFQKLPGVVSVLLGILTVSAASGRVDLSFSAVPSKDVLNNYSSTNGSLVIQPDGKILLFGGFRVVNGTSVGRLIRLNADGSIDSSFNCAECNKMSVGSVLLQPDGKILVAGGDSTALGKSKTVRVNSDGSLDGSFSVALNETGQGVAYGAVLFSLQSDGKIFFGHAAQLGGQGGLTTYRLNSDGSLDNSFASFVTNTRLGRGFVSGIEQSPDGKLFVYGATPFGAFTKLNANGTEDESFERPNFTNDILQIPPSVRDIVVQPNGKVVIAGTFVTVNGLSKINLTRLNADGSVDLTFSDAPNSVGPPLERYPDGKLLVLKGVDISGTAFPAKLTADGGADTALNFPANLITVSNFLMTPASQIYIEGVFNENGRPTEKIARLNGDGSLDPTFNMTVATRGIVRGLALQADGKTVMVGDFDRVNGVLKSNIVRVNPDGSLDSGFDGGTGFDQPARDVAADGDGKLLVFGDFNSYSGTPRPFLARLLSNGGLDGSFNPTVDNSVYTLAVQPDGKILVGGVFSTVNGQTVKRIARLNADGSFDGSFNPVFGSVGWINSIFVQADGKIMVGGSFNGVSGFNRQNLVRLNADGSLDSSFNAGAIDVVRQVSQISNNRYFAATNRIVKLNPDGTTDGGYSSPTFGNASSTGPGLKFLVLPNEGTLVIGDYDQVNNVAHRGITGLFPTGQLAGQTYPVGTNGYTYDIVRQTDGKVILGGDFDLIEYISRTGVVRLTAPVLSKIAGYDFDGDGKADVSVFRPSENKWYVLRSSDFVVVQQVFAVSGDVPAPGDYDGDGKTDFAVFRPSNGDWWYLSSVNNALINVHWGQAGDLPRPADFDGDGKTDFVVYRPSTNFWYRYGSTGVASNLMFGAAGDKPLIGDFNGDGRADPAVFRPSTGHWWYASSATGQFLAVHWGQDGDVPVAADYDGDGRTDFAVFRPGDGGWYIYNSGTGTFTTLAFGIATDKPVAADYDGDGKADIAVFRPSDGIWYLLQSTAGLGGAQWGIATDMPVQNVFVP